MVWKSTISDPGPSSRQYRRGLSALLLILTAALLIGNANLHPDPHSVIDWQNSHLLPSSLMFLTLILALSLYEWKIFVNPFTRYLGKISYSIYLAHPFILEGVIWLVRHNHSALHDKLLHRLRGNIFGALTFFICSTLVCIPICMLLWKFIEQPGIRLGRRIIAKREHRAVSRAALVPPLEELIRPGNTPDAQF
jgi:peptidoglycan/LPS O-acetylase OafA/YrhL